MHVLKRETSKGPSSLLSGQGLGWRGCGGGGVNVAQGLALWACSGHRLVLKQDAVRGQAASVDTRTVF